MTESSSIIQRLITVSFLKATWSFGRKKIVDIFYFDRSTTQADMNNSCSFGSSEWEFFFFVKLINSDRDVVWAIN